MKVLCVLYDDPKGGMPKSYPLSDLPKLEKYPDGMTLPSPKGRDFTPGQLLGCVSGELGLRKFLESNGHELVVTNSKDGDGCEADKHNNVSINNMFIRFASISIFAVSNNQLVSITL